MRDFFVVSSYNFKNVVGKNFFKISTLLITIFTLVGILLPDLFIKNFNFRNGNKYLIVVVDNNKNLFENDIQINRYMKSINEMLDSEFYFDLSEENLSEESLNEIFQNGEIDGYLIVNDEKNIKLVTSEKLGEVKFVLDRFINNKLLKEKFDIDGNKLNVNYEIKSINLNKNKVKNVLEKQTLMFVLTFFMYMIFIIYGQFVSISVNLEKTSKIVEVFLTKIKLSNIILGKIFGVFFAVLLQVIYFIILLFTFVSFLSESKFPFIKSIIVFDFNLTLRYLIYFSLGFLIYCFMFVFIGNLVNKTEDLSIMVAPVIMLISVGYFISVVGFQIPQVKILRFLDYFPFFTPFTFSNGVLGGVDLIKISVMVVALILAIVLNLKTFELIIRYKGKK